MTRLLFLGQKFKFKLWKQPLRKRFIGETQPGLTPCKDAAKRLVELGIVFTPVEDAVRETVESLKAKGFLEDKTAQSQS